jgi:hypothetical protein
MAVGANSVDSRDGAENERDLKRVAANVNSEDVFMRARTKFLLISFAGGVVLGIGSLTAITTFLATSIDKTMKVLGYGAGIIQIVIAVLLLRYAIEKIR